MIVSVDEVLHSEARRQPFAAARCAAKASMLAGESARASKMPARQPMAYSPRGGPPVISGLVPAGGDVGGADLGPNALLAGKADKPVELTLRRDGADRRAVVVPLASEHAARYYDLVARQRAAVCEASGGRLGYLNIPDMMARGWAEFHRDLYTEFRRDGLIMDLRDTQGSDAGQLVAEKLARRIIGWNVSRYEEPSSYPADSRGAGLTVSRATNAAELPSPTSMGPSSRSAMGLVGGTHSAVPGSSPSRGSRASLSLRAWRQMTSVSRSRC